MHKWNTNCSYKVQIISAIIKNNYILRTDQIPSVFVSHSGSWGPFDIIKRTDYKSESIENVQGKYKFTIK